MYTTLPSLLCNVVELEICGRVKLISFIAESSEAIY